MEGVRSFLLLLVLPLVHFYEFQTLQDLFLARQFHEIQVIQRLVLLVFFMRRFA